MAETYSPTLIRSSVLESRESDFGKLPTQSSMWDEGEDWFDKKPQPEKKPREEDEAKSGWEEMAALNQATMKMMKRSLWFP
jgi:hypothetical protein